jgi:DNA-binding PadR family transcriptional regulator
MSDDIQRLLPLTPTVFHMLLALADGEKHGYAIMKTVEEETQGQMQIRIGSLYGSIQRMIEAGLIRELDERPDPNLEDGAHGADSRRRYYGLTDLGRRVLTAESERIARAMSVIRAKRILGGV